MPVSAVVRALFLGWVWNREEKKYLRSTTTPEPPPELTEPPVEYFDVSNDYQ